MNQIGLRNAIATYEEIQRYYELYDLVVDVHVANYSKVNSVIPELYELDKQYGWQVIGIGAGIYGMGAFFVSSDLDNGNHYVFRRPTKVPKMGPLELKVLYNMDSYIDVDLYGWLEC